MAETNKRDINWNLILSILGLCIILGTLYQQLLDSRSDLAALEARHNDLATRFEARDSQVQEYQRNAIRRDDEAVTRDTQILEQLNSIQNQLNELFQRL